jgi:hypothetical protein
VLNKKLTGENLIGEKGFLGPIGDDLPSLIPLIFALVIFFSTFTFAFNVFNEKNSDFQADLDVMNISRVLKGTSLISSIEEFQKNCSTLNITNLKFKAGITNLYSAPENYPYGAEYDPNQNPYPSNAYGIEFFQTTTNPPEEDRIPQQTLPLKCSNIADGSDLDQLINGSPEKYFRGKKLLVRIYPVALQHTKIVYPMHLVVVAWKD